MFRVLPRRLVRVEVMEPNMRQHHEIRPERSIADRELVENSIKIALENWIDEISISNPDLGGFSVCPFAKNNTHKIIICDIDDIVPLNEDYGVVIYVVQDDLDLDYGYQKIEELNKNYPKYKFFEDFRDEPSFIGPKRTNNGQYNLILYQNSEFLRKMRCLLARTTYYDHWNDDYLRKILEEDYEIVQKIRSK
jgi:hypothetical protein